MPQLEQDPIIEITSPTSSVSVTPYMLSPNSSETSISHISDLDIDSVINSDWSFPAPYNHIPIPSEPSIRDILIRAANTRELNSITNIKLQVISIDTSLQYMSIHLPLLRELNLEGSAISSLRDLGYGLKNLKILKVSLCGLRSLDGMFSLDTLEEFYAEDNQITDLTPCGFLPDIRIINLERNKLRDLMEITFLTVCEELEHLILSENEAITTVPLYRQIIKSILPTLKTLDKEDMSSEKTLPEYTKYSEKFFDLNKLDSEEELEVNSQSTSKPTASRSRHEEKGQFVVSFAPKVLSPRSSSASSNGDSSIVSSYRKDLYRTFEEWLHDPDDEN